MGGLSSLQVPHAPSQSQAVTQQETGTQHPGVSEEDKSGKKGKGED